MHNINQLILGDNLEILKTIDSETTDLIYLDPPFFSNRNYEVIWGDEGEVRSFQDRWSGGIDHYIGWLKERVEQMHRILKPTGSIFLHCDCHANSYIRTEILDKIFGNHNFLSEIVWERTTNSGSSKVIAKKFPNDHDTIFHYSKGKIYIFNNLFKPYSAEYIRHYYIYDDNDGRGKYQTQALATVSQERLELLKSENRIVPGKGKVLRFKDYLADKKGVPVNDIWRDIEPVNPIGKERIGYPTQKPEALMQRIIECASNEGDVVLDPFCGGGTTVAVADKLNRNWIGIDQSVQAVKVTEFRLNQQQDLFSKPFIVQLHKYDYDTLRYKNAFEFESWIVHQYGGTSNTKQRNDFGLDGKTKDNTPIQVKRSDSVGRNVIDNFLSAVQRSDKKLFEKNKAEGKSVGYIIAFSFVKGAIQEVARLKNHDNVIIQLVTVEEIVPIAKKPTLTVEVKPLESDKKGIKEIEFNASGHSAVGVEFYSWDFDYKEPTFKAEILLDKKGHQTWRFKPGQHNIAVKVIDNDGLENIEVIRLKVNGGIERQ